MQEEIGGLHEDTHPKLHAVVDTDLPIRVDSSGPPRGKDIEVELDNQFHLLKDRLATHQPSLQIIPIIGMGGIGKTTLVEKVYSDPYVVRRFDIQEWVTVSQQYDVKCIILSLLHISSTCEGLDIEQLGGTLYKRLWARKYLIVIKDIWDTEVWDKVRRFLPDNCNRSRILLTTRISSVGQRIGSSNPRNEVPG